MRRTAGDNFVLFASTVGPVPDRHASAFMHELGHNLGLMHGGGQPDNGKPNYPSIMNYPIAYKYPLGEGVSGGWTIPASAPRSC
jgi:hypothetical protein